MPARMSVDDEARRMIAVYGRRAGQIARDREDRAETEATSGHWQRVGEEIANRASAAADIDGILLRGSRTDEIASAAASSSAPDAVTAASLGVSRARVAQARGETGTPANRPAHRPRSTAYTSRTAAGREALAVLVGIAGKYGVPVPDLLVWLGEASHHASAALVAVDRMREYDDRELPDEITRAQLDAASKWLREGGLARVRARKAT